MVKSLIKGLTYEEKRELEKLRVDIKKYRERDAENNNDSDSNKSKSDDEDDTIEDEKVQISINKAKARLSIPRSGVSSEVYGQFNKRESYVPKFVKKNDEQIQRIKARILQSFLFSGLEQRELDIVIGAMDERHCKASDTVIHQGEAGDCLYVVETGELNCFKRFVK